MPKKTKKQKLKSLERRGNQQPTTISETHIPTIPPDNTKTPHQTFSYRSVSTNQIPPSHASLNPELFSYLRKDLIKTVILALLSCGILVGLSFVLK